MDYMHLFVYVSNNNKALPSHLAAMDVELANGPPGGDQLAGCGSWTRVALKHSYPGEKKKHVKKCLGSWPLTGRLH